MYCARYWDIVGNKTDTAPSILGITIYRDREKPVAATSRPAVLSAVQAMN